MFDDFASKTSEVLANLFEFLECDSSAADTIVPARINQSSPGMLEHLDNSVISRLLEHYRLHNRHLESFLGRRLTAWEHPFQNG